MKNKIISFLKLFAVAPFLGTMSCEKVLFEAEPKSNPIEVYDYFIADIKRNYGLFEYKGIKIDTFGNFSRPKVTLSTSDNQLFEIMARQLETLKDGHNSLQSPSFYAAYDYSRTAPKNNSINLGNYVNFGPPQGAIEYRNMKTASLGYIQIDNFTEKKSEYEVIDKILEEFSDKKGIIIDVRGNGGGQTDYAEIIASRFADKAYTYGKIKTKIGPNPNDFTDWVETKIAPMGKKQFTKPVAILTNRSSFSATEVFLMIMDNFPHVSIVGDTTRGGVGGPISRELPNGWGYRVSSKIWARPDGTSPEGKGVYPDYPIWNKPQSDKDLILEKAIDLLK